MSDSFYWYTKGSGADFDIHDDYLDYTDNIHSTTGVGFNCGDASLVQKNIPSLTKFTVSFTVYACKDDTYSKAAWLWLQLKGYNASKDISFISGSDNVLALFPDGKGPIIPYKYGFSKIKVSINSIDDTLLYYVDDKFVGKKENAGIKDYKFTHISMSCTGGGSGYYGRDNAISDVSIYTDDYISLYLDTRRITTNPMKRKMVGILFDGATNYAKIPISLTDVWNWSAEFTFSTAENRSESAIYHQHCLFGYDTAGYLSRDFHVDVKKGNLYVFNGCGNSKSPSGGTTNYDNADVGIDTGIKIKDGELHTVIVKSIENQIDIYCDDVLATTIYTNTTISNDALYIGCSQIGEKVYGKLSLYSFKLIKQGLNVAEYLPDEAQAKSKKLIDKSGNSNDATLYGNDYATEYGYVDAPSKSVDVLFDMSRRIGNAITQSSDTARYLVESLSTQQDTARALTASAVRYADTSRIISATLNAYDDTRRTVSRDVVINADTVRVIAENIDVDMAADTARNLYRAESLLDDTTRKISNLESINADVQRTVFVDAIDMLDTVRTLTHAAGLVVDTARDVSKSISVNADTARMMDSSTITLHADTSRQLANGTAVMLDTARGISLKVALNVDLLRDTGKISFDADVVRDVYISKIEVLEDTIRRMPYLIDNKMIQSITLTIEEHTISDKMDIKLVGANYMPKDSVRGKFLDYPYNMMILSTTQDKDGIVQTISALYDYYKLNMSRYDVDIKDVDWPPSAAQIIRRVASSLGYKSYINMTDFKPSTTGQKKNKIQNPYPSILSDIVGWTQQLPWREINIFLHGDTLYAIQRGNEPNVVDMTGRHITRPNIARTIYAQRFEMDEFVGLRFGKDVLVSHEWSEYGKKIEEERLKNLYALPGVNYDQFGNIIRYYGTVTYHVQATDENGKDASYDEEHNAEFDASYTYDSDGNITSKTETTKVFSNWGNYVIDTWTNTENYADNRNTFYTVTNGDDAIIGTHPGRPSNVFNPGWTERFVFKAEGGGYAFRRCDTFGYYGDEYTVKGDGGAQGTPFPIYTGTSVWKYLTEGGYDEQKRYFNDVKNHVGMIQETLTFDIVDPVAHGDTSGIHVIDLRDKIRLDGKIYYLVRNVVSMTSKQLKQSLEIVRWF